MILDLSFYNNLNCEEYETIEVLYKICGALYKYINKCRRGNTSKLHKRDNLIFFKFKIYF